MALFVCPLLFLYANTSPLSSHIITNSNRKSILTLIQITVEATDAFDVWALSPIVVPVFGVILDILEEYSSFIFCFEKLLIRDYWQIERTSRLDFLWKLQAQKELQDMRELRHYNTQLLKNILPDHVASYFLTHDRNSEVKSKTLQNWCDSCFVTLNGVGLEVQK